MDENKRTREFEDEARKAIEKVQKAADRLKKEPGADRKNIQRRADRFADGVDTVVDDLKSQQSVPDTKREITTAPIDLRGNYVTADGTRNNYLDRLETHADETIERMREDAEGKK